DTTNGVVRLDVNGRPEPEFTTLLQAPPEGVSLLALQPDGKLLVSASGSYTRTTLRRLHPNGLFDESFVPGTNFGVIYALAL
ncbi:delta-60 repeat domain-containing protein, partial [Streptococcus pyogenes]